MSTQLLTKRNKFLGDVIHNILPKTIIIRNLISYFFFFGFSCLNKALEDKLVKILVGMKIEKNIRVNVKRFERLQADNLTRGRIKENVLRSFVQLCISTSFLFRTGFLSLQPLKFRKTPNQNRTKSNYRGYKKPYTN